MAEELSLDELISEISEPVDINVGTDDKPKILTITYRPSAVTPALEDRLFQVSQRSQLGAVYRLMLVEALVTWNLRGTEAPIEYPLNASEEQAAEIEAENDRRTTPHVLPVNFETISRLPNGVLERIVVGVQSAQSPKKSVSKSSSGSFGAAPVAPFRRGTGS